MKIEVHMKEKIQMVFIFYVERVAWSQQTTHDWLSNWTHDSQWRIYVKTNTMDYFLCNAALLTSIPL